MAKKRASSALDDSVHFVQEVEVETAKGALILALASGAMCPKFALTLPIVMAVHEITRRYIEKRTPPAKMKQGAH